VTITASAGDGVEACVSDAGRETAAQATTGAMEAFELRRGQVPAGDGARWQPAEVSAMAVSAAATAVYVPGWAWRVRMVPAGMDERC
jgi:hypothetical protein